MIFLAISKLMSSGDTLR